MYLTLCISIVYIVDNDCKGSNLTMGTAESAVKNDHVTVTVSLTHYYHNWVISLILCLKIALFSCC